MSTLENRADIEDALLRVQATLELVIDIVGSKPGLSPRGRDGLIFAAENAVVLLNRTMKALNGKASLDAEVAS